jgi:hypothetical protein
VLFEKLLGNDQCGSSQKVQFSLDGCPGLQTVCKHDENRAWRDSRFLDTEFPGRQIRVTNHEGRRRKEVGVSKVIEMNADISCRQTLKDAGFGVESNDSQYTSTDACKIVIDRIDDLSQTKMAVPGDCLNCLV